MLEIISNGSKWVGEKPDSIDDLIKVLEEHTLDPRYEKSGSFIDSDPHWCSDKSAKKYKGCSIIFGDFIDVSHVFNIVTNEQPVIDKLSKAIFANTSTDVYKEEKTNIEKIAKRKRGTS